MGTRAQLLTYPLSLNLRRSHGRVYIASSFLAMILLLMLGGRAEDFFLYRQDNKLMISFLTVLNGNITSRNLGSFLHSC